MHIEFDKSKDKTNQINHGISLTEIENFDWDTATIEQDVRKQYPEARFKAVGYTGERLYVMIYCLRNDGIRVISLRKANKREGIDYAKT
ncbi:BrnT family toxin [Glaciimonas sp. GG7]